MSSTGSMLRVQWQCGAHCVDMKGQQVRWLALIGVLVLGSVHLFLVTQVSKFATHKGQGQCSSRCNLSTHLDLLQHSTKECPFHGRDLKLLFLVHSAISHYQHRIAIRKYFSLLQYKWKLVFILGQSSQEEENRQVSFEASMFGDIVQGRFIDTYRNLTLKHLLGLAWASIRCSQVQSVLKVDDDVFVNYYLLNHLLVPLPKMSKFADNYMIGYLHQDMKVIRNTSSKWYVTREEFAPEQYPPFCSGWAYITKVKTIMSLLCNVKRTPFFWIDDVYVSGLLRPDCVQLHAINHLFNVDLGSLSRWLRWNGQLKWNYLFSNTHNEFTLLQALRMNHEQNEKKA